MAKFIRPFRGVPVGEIYPVQFAAGVDCPAELVAGALSVGALSLDTAPLHALSLVGSNILPSQVPLVDGVTVSLGDVVSHAHAASGLTADAWNALDEGKRDEAIGVSIQQLTAEAEAKKATTSSDPAAAGTGDAGNTPPTAEKGELIQQLEAAGVAFDKRWGVDKLTAALTEARKD